MKSILKTIFVCHVILLATSDLTDQTHWIKDTLNNPILCRDLQVPGMNYM